MNIGSEIRRRRTLLGLSQHDLAKACGFRSRSSINKIELGQRGIPLYMVPRIASALRMTPAELVDWVIEAESEEAEGRKEHG